MSNSYPSNQSGTEGLEIIKCLVRIISRYMDLEETQIVVYNQQWRIPDDEGIHLSVGFQGFKVFGRSRSYSSDADGNLQETISSNRQELYDISLFSKDESARERNQEPVDAFASTYSEQMQELNNFKIAALPLSFVDTSEVVGEGILTRFNITIAVLRGFSRTAPVDFFDDFTGSPKLVTQP